MKNIDMLIKGALLHDIGKIVYRAKSGINHSDAGVNFLVQNRFLHYQDEEDKQILNCVKYHHKNNISANIRDFFIDDLCFIVYEADNISAAMDRRDEGEDTGFKAQILLDNVFNIFDGNTTNDKFKYSVEIKNKFTYPVKEEFLNNKSYYQNILDKLTSSFTLKDIKNLTANELLNIIEQYMKNVPSSTDLSQVCDISLYMHSKTTAAIASCMKYYFDANCITDYKKYCYNKNEKSIGLKEKPVYLLVSGKVSGIQDFIYNVPSKGALKSLRGRVAYLEILLNHFIDELLNQLSLSRCNILHCDGGSFLLLLPNINEAKSYIDELQKKFNKWLLNIFGTQLYLSIGSDTCSANDLIESDSQKNSFATAFSRMSANDFSAYDNATLIELFSFYSQYNMILDGRKECSICHTSAVQLRSYDDDKALICPTCFNLYKLGEAVLNDDFKLTITDKKSIDTIELFSYNKPCYLSVASDKQETENVSYINCDKLLPKYTSRNNDSSISTFDELADKSLGIKRLGVLSMDIDDLKAALIGGFVSKDNAFKYATFSRYASLSENIAYFFKTIIAEICQGNLPKSVNQFNLFGKSKSPLRKIHLVYSANNELFLVGSWDDIIETAVDIQRAFSQFTSHKLTISAGVGLFSSSHPIKKMAETTHTLLQFAKRQPNKNSIALFGFDNRLQTDDEINEFGNSLCYHTYSWADFTDIVCYEKLNFLLSHLSFDNSSGYGLSVGKTLLYRLRELTDPHDKDSMSTARFVYTLARMQTNKSKTQSYDRFSVTMYKWLKNPKDKRELHTAICLLIYSLREK